MLKLLLLRNAASVAARLMFNMHTLMTDGRDVDSDAPNIETHTMHRVSPELAMIKTSVFVQTKARCICGVKKQQAYKELFPR